MGYIEEHYDTLVIRVPKETKCRWQRAAERKEKKLSAYIRDLVESDFDADAGTAQADARYEQVTVRVPKGKKSRWLEAAERQKKTVSGYVRDLVEADFENDLLAALQEREEEEK